MRWIFPARLPDTRDLKRPVHDGDTLWLQLDKGHRDQKAIDNRLKGLFAPELKDTGGPETTAEVMAWLARNGAFMPDARRPWPLCVETFKTRWNPETGDGGNEVKTLDRWVSVVYAGDPADLWAGKPLPCLNTDITLWLHEQHPDWGPGTGG